MGFETQDIERKISAMLKILSESQEALGARIIARRLKDYGLELGERGVRYHLKLMDERGLTRLIGREGRVITESGIEELESGIPRGAFRNKALAQKELLLFQRLNETLAEERPLRCLSLTDEELKSLRGYGLLTLKPMIVLINIGDEQEEVAGPRRGHVGVVLRDRAAHRNAAVVPQRADRRLEMVASDVVEVDVDPIRRHLAEQLG